MRYAVVLKNKNISTDTKITMLNKYQKIYKRACLRFINDELRVVFTQCLTERSAHEHRWDLEDIDILCEVVEL
ncbi:MAG: hypothetical protein ACRC1D_03720 [Culicoidibacterales bacterium]